MVKHSRFAKTAKVFPLERFDVYGMLTSSQRRCLASNGMFTLQLTIYKLR